MNKGKLTPTRHGWVKSGELFVFRTNIKLKSAGLSKHEGFREMVVEDILQAERAEDGDICVFLWDDEDDLSGCGYSLYKYDPESDGTSNMRVWAGYADGENVGLSLCFEKYTRRSRKEKKEGLRRNW